MSFSDLVLPDEYDPAGFVLDPGQMIIWEGQLKSLEEKLTHLYDRAKFYGEYSLTKLEYLEMIEDLMIRAASLHKTGKTL